MAVDAFVHLQTLRCVTLRNTESRVEPYLWPVLLRVDDGTLSGPDPLNLVAVTAPSVSSSRAVIKDSMRAGESAGISSLTGVLRTRFEDGSSVRRLILVVALLEEDETPTKAVRAGFEAFVRALREEVSSHLLALNTTTGDERQAVIKEIQDRVRDRVKSAIGGALSTWEKIKVGAGILNLDDSVGAAFLGFGDPELVAMPFTLTFETTGKILNIPTFQKYEIDGRLELRPVVIDRCQARVVAVRAAQQAVDAIENQIRALKTAFAQASPAEKEILRMEIAELRDEILPGAEAALEQALQALAACRATGQVKVPVDGVVLEPAITPAHDHVPARDQHEREVEPARV